MPGVHVLLQNKLPSVFFSAHADPQTSTLLPSVAVARFEEEQEACDRVQPRCSFTLATQRTETQLFACVKDVKRLYEDI